MSKSFSSCVFETEFVCKDVYQGIPVPVYFNINTFITDSKRLTSTFQLECSPARPLFSSEFVSWGTQDATKDQNKYKELLLTKVEHDTLTISTLLHTDDSFTSHIHTILKSAVGMLSSLNTTLSCWEPCEVSDDNICHLTRKKISPNVFICPGPSQDLQIMCTKTCADFPYKFTLLTRTNTPDFCAPHIFGFWKDVISNLFNQLSHYCDKYLSDTPKNLLDAPNTTIDEQMIIDSGLFNSDGSLSGYEKLLLSCVV